MRRPQCLIFSDMLPQIVTAGRRGVRKLKNEQELGGQGEKAAEIHFVINMSCYQSQHCKGEAAEHH